MNWTGFRILPYQLYREYYYKDNFGDLMDKGAITVKV